jgi:hypothetical protein
VTLSKRRAGTPLSDAELQGRLLKRTARRAAGIGLAQRIMRGIPKAMAGGLVGWGLTKAAGAAEVDAAAAEARPPASPAQAEAGNYRHGHLVLHGLRIAIETPRGAYRRGVSRNGKRWQTRMPAHYGYVKGTEGRDGDQVDVYLARGAHDPRRPVFVVDQVSLPSGRFDEHKAIIGAADEAEALRLYDRGFSDASGPRRRRGVTRMTLAEFRAWLASGATTERLAKAAEDEPPPPEEEPPPPEVRIEREIAQQMAGLFRRWLDAPEEAGSPEALARALEPAIARTFQAAADDVVPPPPPVDGDGYAALPGVPRELAVTFDARSPLVEQHLRAYSLSRIRAISEESRAAVRQALVEASISGAPIPEQARQIRESVGLAPIQVRWVASYRRQLQTLDPRVLDRALRDRRFDRPVARAIETGKPLAAEDIERYVAGYHRRALAYRATAIARTEALRAANTGGLTGARAALATDPGLQVEKTWLATDDDLTRETHRELNGQSVIGLETPFWTTDAQGQRIGIRWPHDDAAPAEQVVHCRCTMTFRLLRAPSALVAVAV